MNAVTIVMKKKSDHKGSVRFDAVDAQAVVTNVYVSRKMPGISGAEQVRVTIEVVSEVAKETQYQ